MTTPTRTRLTSLTESALYARRCYRLDTDSVNARLAPFVRPVASVGDGRMGR